LKFEEVQEAIAKYKPLHLKKRGLLPAPPMISPVPSKFILIPSLSMVKK